MKKIILLQILAFLISTTQANAWFLYPSEPVADKVPSTIEVKNSSLVSIPGKKHWFVTGTYARDLPDEGLNGGEVGVGYIWDAVYVDLKAGYYKANYESINIQHKGINQDNQLKSTAEVGRLRRGDDPANIYSVGPAIGFMYKLFGSDHWTEMGEFRLSYLKYNDAKNDINFIGGMGSMHGGIGYRVGPSIVSAGLTWNLGYVQKTNSPKTRSDEDISNNYLPLQWWTANLNLHLWFF